MDNQEMLNKLMVVYKLIYKILILPESDWKTKIYANTSMSYFINPEDIIPESKLGHKGYVDDFYICLLILRDLKKYREHLINKISSEYKIENLDEFLQENLEYCENELGDDIKKIKKLVGYDSLIKFDIGNESVDEKVSKRLHIRSKMLGIVSFFYNELDKLDKPNQGDFNRKKDYYLKKINESEIFFDIQRICKQIKVSGNIDSKVDKIENINEIFTNYENKLKNLNPKSKYYPLTKYALPLFKTLHNILKDEKCDWCTKHEINSALSYFALIDDIIDDLIESGRGFIDDIFLSSFILFDISERNRELIEKNMPEELNLSIIQGLFEDSSRIVEKQVGHIINLLGLKGLLTYFDIQTYEQKQAKGKISLNKILNTKLKIILIELAHLYFKKEIITEKRFIEETIIEYIEKEIPEELKAEFNKFIEFSLDLSHNKNIIKQIEEAEQEEVKLILLKHKILMD